MHVSYKTLTDQNQSELTRNHSETTRNHQESTRNMQESTRTNLHPCVRSLTLLSGVDS